MSIFPFLPAINDSYLGLKLKMENAFVFVAIKKKTENVNAFKGRDFTALRSKNKKGTPLVVLAQGAAVFLVKL